MRLLAIRWLTNWIRRRFLIGWKQEVRCDIVTALTIRLDGHLVGNRRGLPDGHRARDRDDVIADRRVKAIRSGGPTREIGVVEHMNEVVHCVNWCYYTAAISKVQRVGQHGAFRNGCLVCLDGLPLSKFANWCLSTNIDHRVTGCGGLGGWFVTWDNHVQELVIAAIRRIRPHRS